MNTKTSVRGTTRLVFTGGHHNSALAVIDALNSYQLSAIRLGSLASRRSGPSARRVSYQPFFIGHRYSMHGRKVESAEYREVHSRGIPFYDLKAGKVYRTVNLIEWLRVVGGFFQSLWLLLTIRPSLIVSFGGYLAAPVVVAGWLLRIPAVTHEQTVVSGWSNRFISRFAKKIFISWPQSAKFFPEEKTILTGLPLRKEIVTLAKEIESAEKASPHNALRITHTVYITGGKQGSQVINQAVGGCLEKLLTEFSIIHQCGSLDSERFLQVRASLPQELRDRYLVKDYFSQTEIADVYRQADFVVGRGGAHTVYELAALGKPAILVPIPWVSHHEQQRNAETLADVGLALILPQKELTSETLLAGVLSFGKGLAERRGAGERARDLVRLDGAQNIAAGIAAVLPGGGSTSLENAIA